MTPRRVAVSTSRVGDLFVSEGWAPRCWSPSSKARATADVRRLTRAFRSRSLVGASCQLRWEAQDRRTGVRSCVVAWLRLERVRAGCHVGRKRGDLAGGASYDPVRGLVWSSFSTAVTAVLHHRRWLESQSQNAQLREPVGRWCIDGSHRARRLRLWVLVETGARRTLGRSSLAPVLVQWRPRAAPPEGGTRVHTMRTCVCGWWPACSRHAWSVHGGAGACTYRLRF